MRNHIKEAIGMSSNDKLIPVTKWEDQHSWPSESGLRHLIFHRHDNGFDAVIRRVGRRILIDEDCFYQWVEDQNNKKAS